MTDPIKELSARKEQRPFVPFVIVLKDGRRFQIGRALQYAFSPHRVVLFDERDLSVFFPPRDIADIQLLHPVG